MWVSYTDKDGPCPIGMPGLTGGGCCTADGQQDRSAQCSGRGGGGGGGGGRGGGGVVVVDDDISLVVESLTRAPERGLDRLCLQIATCRDVQP